jgi:hypothetical protein
MSDWIEAVLYYAQNLDNIQIMEFFLSNIKF